MSLSECKEDCAGHGGESECLQAYLLCKLEITWRLDFLILNLALLLPNC